jgi:hypothetical protein
MPKKPKALADGIGSKRVNLHAKKVGGVVINKRIQIRSGATTVKEFHSLQAFIDASIIQGDAATLLYILNADDKQAALRDRFAAFERKEATVYAPAVGIKDTMLKWLADGPTTRLGRPISPKTAASFRQSILDLAKLCDGTEKVSDLPAILAQFRTACIKTQSNSRFNQARSMCCGYARQVSEHGRYSNLYVAVSAIEPMHKDRKRERRSDLMPGDVLKIMEKFEAAGYGYLKHHVWNQTVLACRTDEYLNSADMITVYPDRGAVFIDGTKTKHAKRFAPLVDGLTFAPNRLTRGNAGTFGTGRKSIRAGRPTYGERLFNRVLAEVTKGTIQPYDLRSAGGAWYRKAGIDLIIRKAYFGHSMKGLSEGYATFGDTPVWSRWKDDVVRDTKKLNDWINANLTTMSDDF